MCQEVVADAAPASDRPLATKLSKAYTQLTGGRMVSLFCAVDSDFQTLFIGRKRYSTAFEATPIHCGFISE